MKKILENAQLIKDEIGCMGCDIKNPPYYTLDFHHVGKKEYRIHSLINMGIMDILLYEIQKCILLCAMCHRREHHENSRIRVYD